MHIRTMLATMSLIFALCFAVQGQTTKVNDSLIVTTEWLAKNLNDESFVLLHVGDKDEFAAGHIPRAQLIQTSDLSTPRGQGLTLELPPVEQLKTTLEKFGISNN